LGTRITSRAQKRTSRGAFKKLTTVIDGRRRIVEDPPFRTHALGANDADPEVILRAYAASLPDHVAFVLNQFELADTARQVVGVGSVGMRVYLMLLLERRTLDPLFIQVKQAGPSVYERFSAPCGYEHHGQRVVNGQRMMQSASDLFLGWTVTDDGEFYVRQFRDGKVIPKAETIASRLGSFASMCGQVLARAHARTGSAAAIADYLGTSTKVEDAFVTFASAYADQNDRDHAQLAEAVARGAIPAAPGWG